MVLSSASVLLTHVRASSVMLRLRRGYCYGVVTAAARSRSISSSSFSSSGRNPLDDMPGYVAKFQFSRSSGPGGQNVNKVNTRAQIRVDLDSAVKSGWLEQEEADRLVEAERSRVTSANELIIASQESRTQKENRQACLDKLAAVVRQCRIKPKKRRVKFGISEATKANRRDQKRLRSAVKQNRSRVVDW